MDFKIAGEVQRFFRVGNGATQPGRLTELASLAVAQVEPANAEVLRAGMRFSGGAGTGATGAAQLTAMPTTTAGAVLHNGETGPNAKSYILDFLAAFNLGGTAATSGLVVWATVQQLTQPSAATGWTVQSLSGSSKLSKARWALAQTVVTGQWAPILASPYSLTVNLSQGVAQYFPGGLLLVPPGYAAGFAIVSAAGTAPTYGINAHWSELELDIE